MPTLKSDRTSPSLEIREVRVRRKDEYGGGLALALNGLRRGLNIIRGDNSSGRTTLLQLFEFGLGANIRLSDFIPEIKEYCDYLLIEISLNGAIYTIRRKFYGSNQIEAYEGEIDAPLRPSSTIFSQGREFSDFILRRLDIPRISFLDEYSDRERPILFNDLYDALYLDQEKGFSEIHARLRGKKRQDVFKLLTGITIPGLYGTVIEESSLKKQRAELESDYRAIERFLGSVQLPTQLELTSREKLLQARREELSQELKRVRQQLRSNPNYSDPQREELISLESQLRNKKEELDYSQQTLASYIELENQLSMDLDRVARARSSAKLLSSFEFEKCPRCMQSLTDEMKSREYEAHCSLCGRELETDSDHVDDLESYAAQLVAQIEELHELKEQYERALEVIETEIESLAKELERKREEFDETVEVFVAPVIQNVEHLGYEIAAIDEELARLADTQKWLDRIVDMQEELQEIGRRLSEVNDRRKELEEQERLLSAKIQPFERFFIQFISDIYPNYKKARIDPENFLPLINDHNYKAKSATQKDIAILGYFYALLRYSLEENSNIPRFLVIDTLRQDDLKRELYISILEKFRELEFIYSESFQLFLVVREDFSELQEFELSAPFPLTGGKRLLRL